MPDIQASVGIAKGKPCYNVPDDQLKVQRLLSRIPVSQGGQAGKANWAAPQWRIVAPDLYQAILQFQHANRDKLPYGPDGHVDPYQATIRLMNQLADAAGGTVGGTGGQPKLDGQGLTPNLTGYGTAPTEGLSDYASLGLSGASTVLDLVALAAEIGLAELLSPVIGIITTIVSLPLAWSAADDLAKFNGRCQGFWDAMQDLADAYGDSSLDHKPLADWPPVPTPHPHFSRTPESRLQASEVAWRNGQQEGAMQALQVVTNLDLSPHEFPAKNGDTATTVKLTGRQWLRQLKKAKSGSGQIALWIQTEINKQLKAKGRSEWPVWK